MDHDTTHASEYKGKYESYFWVIFMNKYSLVK